MQQVPIEIIAVAALILLNGFFAGSEISIISVRKSQIQELINKGSKSALLISGFLREPDSFLATIQVGVTFAGTTAAVLAGNAVVPLLTPLLVRAGLETATAHQTAVVIVVIVLSYLLLVIGELIPKYIAYTFPARTALVSAPFVNVFSKFAYLPVKVLSLSTRLLLKPFGLAGKKQVGVASEEEINLIIREGQKEGFFETTERELIEGVFEFADTTVRQAMTPRTEISAIDLQTPHEEILSNITKEGYSRFPIYKESLDNIIGLIHTRDIINLLIHSKLTISPDIIRPVAFVPDSKKISVLLREFQRAKQHMAIVLDEFGGTAGLITLEDILEEIVGEIQDEHDIEVEPFIQISEQVCKVQAQYVIEDFNKQFKVELDEEGLADTIGGFVLDWLGRLPEKGEKVVIDNLEFEVLSLDGPRIDRLQVRKLIEPDNEN